MKFPWAVTGQKVVCVEADGPLVHGAVYTIHSIEPDADGNIYVTLCGLQKEGERAWMPERFRPVLPDTSKQIESMKQMMRHHAASASGGAGIKPKVRA